MNKKQFEEFQEFQVSISKKIDTLSKELDRVKSRRLNELKEKIEERNNCYRLEFDHCTVDEKYRNDVGAKAMYVISGEIVDLKKELDKEEAFFSDK